MFLTNCMSYVRPYLIRAYVPRSVTLQNLTASVRLTLFPRVANILSLVPRLWPQISECKLQHGFITGRLCAAAMDLLDLLQSHLARCGTCVELMHMAVFPQIDVGPQFMVDKHDEPYSIRSSTVVSL